jgi:hypothetical protein
VYLMGFVWLRAAAACCVLYVRGRNIGVGFVWSKSSRFYLRKVCPLSDSFLRVPGKSFVLKFDESFMKLSRGRMKGGGGKLAKQKFFGILFSG